MARFYGASFFRCRGAISISPSSLRKCGRRAKSVKQRIITAIVAFGIFIPFIFIGGLPLTLMIYAIASIGLFEMLRMRKLSIFSIEGLLSWMALALLLLPS